MPADRVRARLSALAAAGLDLDAFANAALAQLRQAVPFDSACLASCDPQTELITGSVKVDIPDARDAEFARLEYEADDVNKMTEIARRPSAVGVLSLDTGGDPMRSIRYRDFLLPHFSHGHEMRAAFRTGGATWGFVSLYRQQGPGGFSPAEADFVSGITPLVALGLRAAVVVAAVRAPDAVSGPAMIVVNAHNQVVQATSAAQARLVELGGDLWGELPITLLSIVGAARAVAAGHTTMMPRSRLRTRSGQWLVIHASPLATREGNHGEVVLTIEEARPPEVVPLVIAAFGLTGRERDVVRLVLQGSGTQEIGKQLHLSPYTVQDHLKTIFGRAGVRSRRELVARVFSDHYASPLA
ncbi:helix-turn-helix transcriptional regulator [Nonomuraea jabiensis]|uniref:helix-turn-helix transcriptional regulator n=1 Tax=Nonomuraea jabiensis TaxID=882448 RepID=UPI003676E96C